MSNNESAYEMAIRQRKEREVLEKLCESSVMKEFRKHEEQKSREFNNNEVIRKAASGDNDAYVMYNREQKTEHIDMYRDAQVDIRKCIEEFNEIASRTIQKSGETDIQLEARIWQQNPGLYSRLSQAQSILANLQKTGGR